MISIETHQAKARANQFASSCLNHCWCSSSWPSQMMWTSDWREHMWTKLMPRYAKAKAWFQGRWSRNSLLASVPTCTHYWCPLVIIWIRNGSHGFLVICTGMSQEPLEGERVPYLDQAELSTLLAYYLSVIYPVKYLIHVFSAFGPWFAHCKGMGILAWDGAETPIKHSRKEPRQNGNLGNWRIALSKHPDSREKYPLAREVGIH